jgi:dTDP-4-amino-4,6-dideoxygalactose transaminase
MLNNIMIPFGKQDINQQDIDAVVEVLKSDFLTQGPKVPAFEQALQEQCDVKHVIAVNSATSALHIACLALEVGEGDLVWTTPISFVASANCALYCGAKVDFVDIDPLTYNLCSVKLAEKLCYAKEHDLQIPKVLILVHLSGEPCDMVEIHKLSKLYNFAIVEDASHAIGSEYKGQKIGSCQFSDITVFSFHPVKIITAAEGGVATTNNTELAEKLLLLRSHGITINESLMTEKSHGDWYYQQVLLGLAK